MISKSPNDTHSVADAGPTLQRTERARQRTGMNEEAAGDALLKILQEALSHERTKKRRRMAPDPETAPMTALRVYKEVSTAVRRIKATRCQRRLRVVGGRSRVLRAPSGMTNRG